MICSVEINQSWAHEKIVYVATSDYMLQRKINSTQYLLLQQQQMAVAIASKDTHYIFMCTVKTPMP